MINSIVDNFVNIVIAIIILVVGLLSGLKIGAYKAEAEQKEVMIKHLISPFHNAEHVWQDPNNVNYQVVPSDMICAYPRDTTHTPVDTTEH